MRKLYYPYTTYIATDETQLTASGDSVENALEDFKYEYGEDATSVIKLTIDMSSTPPTVDAEFVKIEGQQ